MIDEMSVLIISLFVFLGGVIFGGWLSWKDAENAVKKGLVNWANAMTLHFQSQEKQNIDKPDIKKVSTEFQEPTK